MNVAVVAFAATGTDEGAVKIPAALLPSTTVTPPAGAACDSVIVHVVLLLETSAADVQPKDVTVTVVCSDSVVLADPPLSEAVSVAV